MNQTTKAVGRIIVAVVLGILVLGVSSSVAIVISKRFPGLERSLPMGEGFLVQVGILFLSVLLIVAISKGQFSRYGFRIGDNIQLPRIVILGLAVGFASSLAGLAAPGGIPQPAYNSFFDLIIGVWILASIAEEVLTRGLIQGFLSPLTGLGFSIGRLRISLPVLISAIFFGLMHLGLLSTGANLIAVTILVIFAFILGIVAGYYREKSESLIPAIIVHMCGNAGGWLAEALLNI